MSLHKASKSIDAKKCHVEEKFISQYITPREWTQKKLNHFYYKKYISEMDFLYHTLYKWFCATFNTLLTFITDLQLLFHY